MGATEMNAAIVKSKTNNRRRFIILSFLNSKNHLLDRETHGNKTPPCCRFQVGVYTLMTRCANACKQANTVFKTCQAERMSAASKDEQANIKYNCFIMVHQYVQCIIVPCSSVLGR